MAKIVGFESDRERVTLLFASLMVQMFGALGRTAIPWGVAPVTFRKSFCHGYTVRIRERLTAAEHKAAEEATASSERNAALVLRDREKQVESRFAKLFPAARPGRPYRRSTQGARDGAAAANQADLGGERVGGPTRQPLPRGAAATRSP
jgi:hypothetical protein